MSSTSCSCADSVGATDSADTATLGRHLSSCMIGPAASASSLLNEWLLIRTLQLAGELPDPLPSPAPVQYAMVLPSLQLLSFIVCHNADSTAAMAHSTSSRYDHGAHDVVVTVRDCRIKRVWRMRQCYGPKRTATAAATVPLTPLPSSPPLPSSNAADDRFYTAWLSSRQQHVTVDEKFIAAPTTATASASATATSSAPPPAASSSSIAAAPATTALAATAPTTTAPTGSVTSSFSSNLRTAIAAARAKSPPFASSLGPTASGHSTWKAAPHPFSLFDAWGEAEAWLTNQQHNTEHEQYLRCIREQMATCTQQPPQAQPTSLERPSVEKQATEVGDGWNELHSLLHHLGFFSSLLPIHAGLSASALFPYSLPPTTFSLLPSAADVSRPSLMLLHPSTALNDSIDELDAISDTQLHRVMILTRRPLQSSEWEMLANRFEVDDDEQQGGDDTGKAHDDEASREAFSSLVAALADLSSHSRLSEQLVWFVSSRLCPMLLSEAAETSSAHSTDAGRPSVWTNLLSACPVRVVWCEGEADYVSPHRQRQKDRRQKRLARETGDGDGKAGEPDMLSRSSSPHNSPDAATMALAQPPCPAALVYIVVSFHPPDATYRVRVDCDWRLRNKQRRVNQQQTSQGRSQSHSNAIISASSASGAMHSTRWLPPPLLKSNSLTNAHPPPPPSSSSASLSSTSTGTVIKSLFKRLGSRSARSNGQPSDHLSVNDGPRSGSSTVNSSAASSRTSSLSPARSSTASSSLFGTRRSPRRGHVSKQDSEVGAVSSQHNQQQHHNQQQAQQQQAARRRSERADALRRHPVLSQPFPPSDCFVGGVDSLAARLSDTALLSARRVHAWREWRSLSRRRQQVERHSRQGSSRRGYEGEEREVPQLGFSSAADFAMDERSRLLREIARDHGELVTPAAFLESLFGQRVQDAPAPH